MSVQDLEKFLESIQNNTELLQKVSNAATANEIAEIAYNYGFKFTGKELKEIAKEGVSGVKIKHQDTSPSYSFGESGN